MEREAAAAREAAEQLRTRLRTAEGELADVRGRLGGEARAAKERAERLQVRAPGPLGRPLSRLCQAKRKQLYAAWQGTMWPKAEESA